MPPMMNILEHRTRVGITQAKLAELAGVSERTVIRLELDPGYTPNMATAKALADALGVTIDDLLRDATPA